MALTITNVQKNVEGARRVFSADVQFDNSYPTGGEAFGPADIDPGNAASTSKFSDLLVYQKYSTGTTPGLNRLFTYDRDNGKVMIFTAIGTEATNASDQSAITAHVTGYYGQVTG